MVRKDLIVCKVCDAGYLSRESVPRFGGCVCSIGHIFLLPTYLGCLLALGMLAGAIIEKIAETSSPPKHLASTVLAPMKRELLEHGIDEATAKRVVTLDYFPPSDLLTMTEEQKNLIGHTQETIRAMDAAAAPPANPMAKPTPSIGATILGSGFVVLVSLVTGVFGFILVMKRAILKCSNCGAVTPAS
jgi:hypothetical protein